VIIFTECLEKRAASVFRVVEWAELVKIIPLPYVPKALFSTIPEGGGRTFLRNIGNNLSEYTA
jgi:hypothetical protein